jgi:flagellar motor component MotA
MNKGRIVILDKLFTATENSPYQKIIKETYQMLEKKREKIIIKYETKPDDIKAYTDLNEGRSMNTVAYHNSIHQLIKIFDEKSKVKTIKEKLNGEIERLSNRIKNR